MIFSASFEEACAWGFLLWLAWKALNGAWNFVVPRAWDWIYWRVYVWKMRPRRTKRRE